MELILIVKWTKLY